MIASQKQKRSQSHITMGDFLYHWIGGTFLMWGVAAFLGGAQIVMMMLVMYMLGLHGSGQSMMLLAASVTVGATIGYLVGKLQYHLMSERGRPIYEWVPASMLGGIVGLPLTLGLIGWLQLTNAAAIWYTVLPLPLFMLCLSGAQLLVLRRYSPYALVWMLACVGGALGYVLLQGVWLLAVLLQGALMGGAIWWLTERMIDDVTAVTVDTAGIFPDHA